MRECAEDRIRGSGTIDRDYQGRIQGGGGPTPFRKCRSIGRSIDFYSGLKKHKEGVQFEILRNPGIDFHSGFRKISR